MGNIRSKSNLDTILKKWERSESGDNECKSFSYKINGVTIHKVDGEFFVENRNTVIGPMSQEQLTMLSKKNSDFQLNPNYCNRPMPDGDRINNEILIDNSLSTKPNQLNAQISKISTNTNILPVNFLKNKIPKSDNQSKSSDKISESIISELKTDELSLNLIGNTKVYNTQSEIRSVDCQKNIKPILKQKNPVGKYFKTNPSNMLKSQPRNSIENKTTNKNPTSYSRNVIFYKNSCNDAKINGRFPERKSLKTTVKELNLSYSKKKNLKRQFNLNIISKYKEDLKIQELKNDIEMRMADDICDSIQLNCSMRPHFDLCNSQKIQSIGFTEPINKEKYRYTAFVKAENLNWPKQKSLVRRLKYAFEEKFGCTVQLGDEFVEYRGNVIYTVNIEGKDKLAVLKCRNSLPFELKTNLILSRNNSEEVNGVLNERWKSTIPYNPRIIINELGSKTMKLSY